MVSRRFPIRAATPWYDVTGKIEEKYRIKRAKPPSQTWFIQAGYPEPARWLPGIHLCSSTSASKGGERFSIPRDGASCTDREERPTRARRGSQPDRCRNCVRRAPRRGLV